MLLIVTEIIPKIGFFSLEKAFQLASLTCKKENILFSIEGNIDLSPYFKGRGYKYLGNTELLKIFKEKVSVVLFFKDIFSEIDKKILSQAKKKGIPTVKYSYFGQSPEDIDVIVDPSPFEYDGQTEERSILSGPEYTILHHKYIHFHNLDRKYKKKLRNILLDPGNRLPYRELRKLTELLLNRGYRVKIIPGKDFEKFNRKTLKRLYPSLKISGTPESYARTYFETDLAIIDPDISSVKAAVTGTPAIYLQGTGNDELTAQYFEENGAGLLFRRWKREDYSEISELLKFFSFEKRKEIGQAGKLLADGKGVYKISKILRSFLKE